MHDHTVATTRYFTPEEASELLSAVRPLAEQIVEHRRLLAVALQRRERLQVVVGGNGGNLPPRAFAELESEVQGASAEVARCVREIHELGAQIKDLDRGLVDFPALRDGEEVLLCWQLGEERVGHWHGLDDGFAGRRELPP
ncbi:MAG: DUF2203 domain-containing protein [Candidatus Rokuibacteriota bacterium]|nr:MAG: DUF2203 domain-containing protein [Candidatus Rokubacteria bacterium]